MQIHNVRNVCDIITLFLVFNSRNSPFIYMYLSYDNDEDNRQYIGISIISHTKHKNSGNRATGRSDKG